MCRKQTIDDKLKFERVVSITANEFSFNNDFITKKSKQPEYVNAFRIIVCLCLLGGLCGAEIARLSKRNCRGIYKVRNIAYKLLEKDSEFKRKYLSIKKIIHNNYI